MKKLSMLVLVLAIMAFALVGCGSDDTSASTPAPAPAPSTPAPATSEPANETPDVDFSRMIEVRGSDTMVNLGQAWAEAFMDKYPEALIAVTGGGSGTGIAALINNTADMAQSSRAMREGEKEQAEANGYELMEFVPGRDGIAIAVHQDNPIEYLTMAQVKDIFTGKITNWSEVGGANEGIVLYSRESNSGTYAFFKEFVLEDEEYAQTSLLMPSTGAIVDGLRQSENGIGYIGLGYLADDIKAVPIAQEEGAEAFLPSLETINSTDYPVARELFLYTPGEPEGVLKLYMDFIFSEEGQQIIKDLQFVPIK